MKPVQAQDAPIRGQLRDAVGIGGTTGAMAEPWILEAPSVFQFPEQVAENGGAGGQATPEGGPVAVVAKRSRICQHCLTCGHKMRMGPFKRQPRALFGIRGGDSLHLTRGSQARCPDTKGKKRDKKLSRAVRMRRGRRSSRGL